MLESTTLGSVALGAKKKPGFLKAGLLRFRLKASD